MQRKEKLFRFLSGLISMVFGTTVVLSLLLLINDSKHEEDNKFKKQNNQIQFKHKKQVSKQTVQRKKPKPRKKRHAPPAPLLNLNSLVSGIDLGLADFSMEGANGIDNDLLGNSKGLIMTDDTVDSSPRAIYRAPANYPAKARASGTEGYVLFSLLIGITGTIEQLKIIESEPQGFFDKAATQSMQNWKFEPAQFQGQAVKAWAKQRIRFDLS